VSLTLTDVHSGSAAGAYSTLVAPVCTQISGVLVTSRSPSRLRDRPLSVSVSLSLSVISRPHVEDGAAAECVGARQRTSAGGGGDQNRL
jgi:hypothetical protein